MKNPFKQSKTKQSISSQANTEYTDKYIEAKAQFDRDAFNEWYSLYLGTKHVKSNINSKSAQPTKLANNVRNAAYEMIESQVNTQIPSPNVRSKMPGFDWLAKLTKNKLINDLEESCINKIHDENERLTPIYGLSIVMLAWNPDFKHNLYNGEKKFINIDPKQLIPQPRVYDINKMDYFFIELPSTKKSVKDKYGIDVDDESESEPELNVLDDDTVNTGRSTATDEMVTEVMMFYRDSDGDVCLYVFVNNTELLDAKKFYLPKVMECQECKEENPQGSKECEYCGSKKLKVIDKEYEEIKKSLMLNPIEFKDHTKTVEADETGQPRVITNDFTKVIERNVEAGTKVKRFKPTTYPVVVRINTPHQYKFGGQSDLAVISDQLVSLSKIISKIEEKIIMSGSIVAVPENAQFTLTDQVYQVIKMSPADAQLLRVETLQADIQQDILYAREQYEMLKSTLGITDSFQGKNEVSAESGKAKQLKIQQSAGRLGSKIFNKFDSYSQLFKLMFEFDLCFTNEIRPFVMRDSNGSDDWGHFDKHEFLVQDNAGEWYYNADMIINADASSGMPNDIMFLLEQTQNQYQAGLIDKKQYWTILKNIGFPNANMMLDAFITTEQSGDKIKVLLDQIREMPPEQRDAFFNMPPEEQDQYIGQVMG